MSDALVPLMHKLYFHSDSDWLFLTNWLREMSAGGHVGPVMAVELMAVGRYLKSVGCPPPNFFIANDRVHFQFADGLVVLFDGLVRASEALVLRSYLLTPGREPFEFCGRHLWPLAVLNAIGGRDAPTDLRD